MTLRRRRLWFVLIAGVVVALGVWAVATSISTRDADRVKDGMAKEQVANILGKPASPAIPGDFFWAGDRNFQGPYCDVWEARDGIIIIWYDRDGLVENRTIKTVGMVQWQWRRLRNKLGLSKVQPGCLSLPSVD